MLSKPCKSKVLSFDSFNELIVRDLETRRFLAVFPIKREFVQNNFVLRSVL